MKIYTQHNSWRGAIVVIADSMDEAKNKMRHFENFSEIDKVIEHEINNQFTFCCMGDS